MTDDQFERIKKGLNFHSEGGVYNLCTLTETALREIIEDAVKSYEKQQKIDALHIMELQKQNGELTDELAKKADTNHQLVEQLAKLTDNVKELEAQITDMKNYCCEVSKYLHDYSGVELNSPECRKRDILLIKELKLCEKWGDLR